MGSLPGVERVYTAAVTALRTRELRHLLRTLHSAGLVPVLLKGAAFLASGIYRDPAARAMGDLDLWILPEFIPKAVEILQCVGYRPLHKPLRPSPLREQYEQEVELGTAWPWGGVVDLHYWPFQGMWARLVADLPQRDLWARRRVGMWNGLPYALLAPEDFLLHLLYHAVVNHHLSAPGHKVASDVAVSLRAWPVNWEIVGQRARGWGIATVTWLGLTFVGRRFPHLIPTNILDSLAPPPPRQRLLQCFIPPPGVVLPERGRRRYLLYFALCDSPRARMRLATWALWPEDAWLRARYGDSSFWVRVSHIARVFTHSRF